MRIDMPELEIYVSPETAGRLAQGSTVTVEVASLQQVGNGFLVTGSGRIEAPDKAAELPPAPPPPTEAATSAPASPPQKPQASPESAAASGDISLSGSADVQRGGYSSDVGRAVREAAQAIPDPPPAKEASATPPPADPPKPANKAKFGQRGPQLAGLEDTPSEAPAPAPGGQASTPSPASAASTILSAEDFYKFLDGVKDSAKPGEQQKEARLSRSEAVSMEASGGVGPSIWIINQAKGQLVLNDLGVTLRYGDALNLSGLSAVKMKRSVDLFEAISRKLVRIASPQEAEEASKRTQRRIERLTVGETMVFDSADQVFDEIEDSSWPEDEDMDGGVRQGSRRKAQADSRFRRGITSPKGRRIQVEDEDGFEDRMARASVRPPDKFRGMRGQNILDDDDEGGEFDRIERDVRRRQSEIGRPEQLEAEDHAEIEGLAEARRARERVAARGESKWGTVARLE